MKKTYSKEKNKRNKERFKNLKEDSEESLACNEDILREILLCVPAKSLIRFKCVSKCWLSLISDPIFCSNHARRNSNSLVSGIYLYYLQLLPISRGKINSGFIPIMNRSFPKLKFLGHGMEIVNACNGLILCSDGTQYMVCNPTTKKCKTINNHPDVTLSNDIGRACLVFDPLKSNQYKVVRFLVDPKTKLHEVRIYSSEYSSWKRITEARERPLNRKIVFWNGSLHWLRGGFLDIFISLHIQFDVDTEKLTSTPLDMHFDYMFESISYFGACGSHLVMVSCPFFKPTKLTIFEMESNVKGWVKKHQLDLDPYKYLINKKPMGGMRHIGSGIQVYSVIKEDNCDDVLIILAFGGKILSFDTKSKTMQLLAHLRHTSSYRRCDSAYQLLETLSPV